MKFSLFLIGILFSIHAQAYRVDAEASFYVGKSLTLVNPYYEENDGTRFPINVTYFKGDEFIPELAHLCSMYMNASADQIQADALTGYKEGMLYRINKGFSPLPLPSSNFISIKHLTCFSNQHQSPPLGGKTTYSADGSMTVELPTVEHNGKDYPIAPCRECMKGFCRLLGYPFLKEANFALMRSQQRTEVINFSIRVGEDNFHVEPEIKKSGKSPFLVLDSFTCTHAQ